jgi:hypothetical protein
LFWWSEDNGKVLMLKGLAGKTTVENCVTDKGGEGFANAKMCKCKNEIQGQLNIE